MNQKYNIICFSNQLWLKEYWTNKSQVMSRLSRAGHKVLFVEPPINTGNIFFRQVKQGAWSLKRLLTHTSTQEDTGILVYSPLNVIPSSNITTEWHIRHINKLTKNFFDPQRKTIIWIYHVQLKNLFNYINQIPHDLMIYDCVDNYLGFPADTSFHSTNVSGEELMIQEASLAKRANLVFATAPGLVAKLSPLNPNTFFTPNVGDYEKFKDSKNIKQLPEDIRLIKKPVIGFTGALDEHKFDLELFKQLAQSYPQYSFVLIGSLVRNDRTVSKESLGLKNFHNVHLLGSRPYGIIQNYYAGFNAFIIPYQLNDLTVGGCFPVKFHDALAAGLPVIVTDLPAYAPFKDVCYISRSSREFIENVKRALDEDSSRRIAARQEVAKENNWDGKVANMLKLINKFLS